MNPLHIDFSAVPDELKTLARWVAWRTIVRDGKATKVPVNPKNRQLASCSDPDTWGTYADAMALLNSGTVDGIGLQVCAPHVGIDLDGCRNPAAGEIKAWARKLIKQLGGYTEISPSGNGVHIWVKGTLPAHGRKRGPVEMYSSGRFLTVTGIHVAGTPTTVEERQAELTDLHVQVFGTADSSRGTVTGASTNLVPDEELIDRARNAENGEKFGRLWNGDYTGYASQSEADLALCVILAFSSGKNAERIDSLFRQSKLVRTKWDDRHSAGGRTYGQLTIDKAIASTGDVWSQSPARANSNVDGNDNARPSIVYTNRQLDAVTREAVEVLRANNAPPELFVRKRQLVRIGRDEDERHVIELVGEPELRARLARISDSIGIGSGGAVNCFPSKDVVRNILALGGWPFPILQNVVEVPVLRPDGSVVATPGYDPKTRLLYLPASHLQVPEIPERPTKLDVAAALDLIFEVIEDFPFEDDGSKANAIAVMLTSIMRFAIKGKTPLALIDAPQAGTGKGLLAEVVGLVATGRESAMMSAPYDENEWRKRITAALLSGTAIIVIDNVESQLWSVSLASALTASEWTDRVLGQSKMVTLPVRVTWIATGNNIRLGGDMPRRCYWIRMDAKTARPWKRTHFRHADLLAWVSEQRGEIVAALFTLARAWYAAGKPQTALPMVGSFQEWARTIAAVLGFVGVKGFLSNLDEMYERADESAAQWEHFLEALASAFEDKPFTVKELVERMASNPEINESLPDDVAYVADEEDKNAGYRRRMGKAFSKREGRRYGDMDIHLERAGEEKRAVKWCVERG